MRLFIGIPIYGDYSKSIYEQASLLQRNIKLKNLRWVRPGNWHITIAFVGEVETKKISILAENLSNNLYQNGGFVIKAKELSVLPPALPQALVVLIEKSQVLDDLRKIILQTIRESGINIKSKNYKPHITLARFKKQHISDVCAQIEMYQKPECIDIPVHEIVLWQSQLHKKGSIYTPILRIDC